MFFLKELPSRHMVDGYANQHGVAAATIIDRLTTLRQASLLIRRLESYFVSAGLSQLRFLVLMIIDREPDSETLTVGEIADRLDVAGPVIARTLRSLLADGLITSSKDGNDARTKHIGLTKAGHDALTGLLPGYFAILTDEMGGD